MTTPHQFHASLLRAPILHILRAAGFHSTRPSVLDTLVSITERYLLLLCTSTHTHALNNHNTPTPDITDVRLALTDAGALVPHLSAAEEDWLEKFRRPLSDYDALPYGALRRQGELERRADVDVADVRAFIKWIVGDQNREIRRVAGVLPEVGPGGTSVPDDFLTALKKKHSKTGEESRYAGTVLGRGGEEHEVLIEGGPAETLAQWAEGVREREGRGDEETALQRAAHEEEQAEQQLQIAMDVS